MHNLISASGFFKRDLITGFHNKTELALSGKNDTIEKAYQLLTIDDDRACRDIPDSACREAPGNFFLNAGNGALTKLAGQIASPGLVLPWLLSAMGAPSSLSGLFRLPDPEKMVPGS